jgi:exonuclease III
MHPGQHALAPVLWLAALTALAGSGCRDLAGLSADSQASDAIAADADAPARDAHGGDGGLARDAGPVGARLDLATWNIENFPLDVTTPDRVEEILNSLDLDLVAVQEIANEAVFELLLDRLDGYDYVLSDHEYGDGTYQKAAFIYRESALRVLNVALPFRHEQPECFEEDTFEPFPRPPLVVTFAAEGPFAELDYEFTAINVHMKALFPPSCGDDCRERRACANRHLEAYVQDRVEDPRRTPNVIVLGDFNEHLDNGTALDPFQHWSSPAYHILTSVLGPDDYSYVGRESLIDHALVTEAMSTSFDDGATQVRYLDREIEGYLEYVSDHVPVTMSFDPSR